MCSFDCFVLIKTFYFNFHRPLKRIWHSVAQQNFFVTICFGYNHICPFSVIFAGGQKWRTFHQLKTLKTLKFFCRWLWSTFLVWSCQDLHLFLLNLTLHSLSLSLLLLTSDHFCNHRLHHLIEILQASNLSARRYKRASQPQKLSRTYKKISSQPAS